MSRGEGIKKLNSLFEKYKKTLKAPQGSVIAAFCEVVEEVLGMTIRRDQVAYTLHTRCLYITARGPLKSEILQQKAEILAHLKGRLGEAGAPTELL